MRNDAVQAQLIDLQPSQGFAGHLPRDHVVGLHLGVVARPLEQPVGDPGRASGAPRYLGEAVGLGARAGGTAGDGGLKAKGLWPVMDGFEVAELVACTGSTTRSSCKSVDYSVNDEREYSVAAHMIDSLHIKLIRLMTNNPRKVAELTRHGVSVTERIPMIIPPNPYNEFYLDTKVTKSGHLLDPNGNERLLEQGDRPVVEGMVPEQVATLHP